ncbi:MAG: type I-MYXAN CRISPR-associated protein Cas6/Cmx6 [Pseudomonadota bacterium]
MFWQEDNDENQPFEPSDIVVDLIFRLQGTRVPVDHAQSLANALRSHLPEEVFASLGVHPVRVAESGNGWIRPEQTDAKIDLSRRTRLILRVPNSHVEKVQSLSGESLDISGDSLVIGPSKIRKLSTLATLFSHGIVCDDFPEEESFTRWVAKELDALGIPVKKLLCGMTRVIVTDDGEWVTRSLLIADLTPQDSLLLQQEGLGSGRQLGCGIFIPHKGIAPVYTAQE